MAEETLIKPGLFGQKYSSRDYGKSEFWGKNQFNSSFPASLVAYMHSKKIAPVYLTVDKSNAFKHTYIPADTLFGIDPLSEEAFYNFEAGFSAYEQYYTGNREKIDLVMMDRTSGNNLIGLEIKLTAIPDNTTRHLGEEKYSSEIVMRPPTICFLACSICDYYKRHQNRLRELLMGVPQIKHWEEPNEVAPHYRAIEDAVLRVSANMYKHQAPLIIQPIWKTVGGNMRLADDCLDVFVWSNLATIQMCVQDKAAKLSETNINRFQRTIIWLYRCCSTMWLTANSIM